MCSVHLGATPNRNLVAALTRNTSKMLTTGEPLGFLKLLGKARLESTQPLPSERQGCPRASPFLLGYDQDVVEEEEVANPARALTEDSCLLGEEQVELAPLQQPAGGRDQWKRLKWKKNE